MKIVYILIGLIVAFSLVPIFSARAGDIIDITVSPSNLYGTFTASYTIAFTATTTINTASSTVTTFTFPAGFDVADAATSTDPTGFDGGLSVSNQIISVTGAGYAAGEKSITFDSIVSPSAGGSFTVAIATSGDGEAVDSGTSAAFTIYACCVSPSRPVDTSPPISKITKPTAGVTIPAGEPYVIEGIGSDESAVVKVEVSLDDGKTWSVAKSSSVAGSFSWEYVWQNPTEGEYTIKARATDTVGNIESPSAGVKVTVPAAVPPEEVPAEVPEKPISEMTAQELQAKILEIQQKIIDLLQQLIQLIQQQIQELLT